MRTIPTPSRGTSGVPRGPAWLRDHERRVSGKRVARLRQAAGLRGGGRRRRVRTTVSEPTATPAPNLVARQFTVGDLTQRRVTELTDRWTAAGWV